MRFGGLLKFSLIDYPGKVAAVLFTQGCNYRCPFCHNPELVVPELFTAGVDTAEVMAFLEKRRGQLQGIVITGGEPTLQGDLPDFMATVKAMGYLVKLDTNGSRPGVLKDVITRKLVDLLAMDLKTSWENYPKACGVTVDTAEVMASVELIRTSGIAHIFRTTVVRGIVSDDDIALIRGFLGPGETHKLQRGNLAGRVLDSALLDGPADFEDSEWERMKQIGLST